MPAEIAMITYFSRLNDPRRDHLKRHLMVDMIVIAVCAVIAGADDWQEIALFGRRREAWLREFLRLPNGIPSHDTFERLFDALNAADFEKCFREWSMSLAGVLGLKHVAIDGKTVRGRGQPSGVGRLHLVSAWAVANGLSVGQVAVGDKSNEITAIPKLLELLDVKGAIVTIDAMGCQKGIAKKVRDSGGDYVLTVKENQPGLLSGIQEKIANGYESDYEGVDHDYFHTDEVSHGRRERRTYLVLRDVKGVSGTEGWEDLSAIGVCFSERMIGDKSSEEVRYFIGSRAASAREYGGWLRGHWGIENGLHWQLDVTFREDYCREQGRNAGQNLAVLRKIALNAIRQHPGRGSIKCKRYQAALDEEFLEEVLLGVSKQAKLNA